MLSEIAHAKVNLYLHVLGRRADGRHDLDSLIVFTEIGDRITVRPADGFALEVGGPFAASVGGPDDNLVLRAARALQETTGTSQGAAIQLDKKIPVAAGLGGGSADAAATLRLLSRLWRLEHAGERLAEIAARIGSDVTACLASQPCYVAGGGDTVEAAPALPDTHTVLVNPGVALATGDVFAALDQPFAAGWARLVSPIGGVQGLASQLAGRRNDLEKTASAMVPEIGVALRALAGLPGCFLSRMSGSGATCFGLFGRASEAAAGAALLQNTHGDWWVRDTILRGANALAPVEAAQ